MYIMRYLLVSGYHGIVRNIVGRSVMEPRVDTRAFTELITDSVFRCIGCDGVYDSVLEQYKVVDMTLKGHDTCGISVYLGPYCNTCFMGFCRTWMRSC